MKEFISRNFLLNTEIAGRLFHDHARDLPIIDYHNHLSPEMIASNHGFSDITEVWLYGDHYKWRAMRANGVDEKYVTGAASNKEKFDKWAETVPQTLRNPLYHWTHLELKRYFGIDQLLSSETADSIYAKTQEYLNLPEYSTQGLLNRMKVETVCTTDNPWDDLSAHMSYSDHKHSMKLLPTFRPDSLLNIATDSFLVSLEKLEQVTDKEILSYDDLILALRRRIAHFNDVGCKLSDHGLSYIWSPSVDSYDLDTIISKKRDGKILSPDEAAFYGLQLLIDLSEIYYEYGWVVQLHLGAIRNNNRRLIKSLGTDVGCDSIGDWRQADGLSYYLGTLDERGKLSRTILYNLNPADNEVFATMAGNFNDGITPGKIQWGSAWWFLDQKDGMEKQINTLSNMGLLSRFIGMLTDSRSFLSFPRHEYFRRILCNLIGDDVKNGTLPDDELLLSELVKNICYFNAKKYFNF